MTGQRGAGPRFMSAIPLLYHSSANRGSIITLIRTAECGDGELTQASTVKEYLTVQTEGSRPIQRSIEYYNSPSAHTPQNRASFHVPYIRSSDKEIAPAPYPLL